MAEKSNSCQLLKATATCQMPWSWQHNKIKTSSLAVETQTIVNKLETQQPIKLVTLESWPLYSTVLLSYYALLQNKSQALNTSEFRKVQTSDYFQALVAKFRHAAESRNSLNQKEKHRKGARISLKVLILSERCSNY